MSRRKSAETSTRATPRAGGRVALPVRPPGAVAGAGERIRPPLGATEAILLAVAALTPSLLNPAGVRIFEPEKVAFLRSAALVLLALWVARGERIHEGPRRDPFVALRGFVPLALPVLALLAVYLVSALLSEQPWIGLLGSYRRQFGAATHLAYGVIFFAVALHFRAPERARRLLLAIALGTLVPSLLALPLLLQPFGLATLPWFVGVGDRASSTLGNASYLGGLLAAALPASLFLLAESRSRPARAGLLVLLALQVAALALSGSRASWVAAAAGGGILALAPGSPWSRSKLRRSWALRIGAALALALLVAANVPGTGLHEVAARTPLVGRLARLAEFESGSGRVRVLIWEQVPALVAERPLLGHGPDQLSYAFERYYRPDLFRAEGSPTAVADRTHNWLLDALATTGLVGTAALLWLLGSVLALYWRATRGWGDGETQGRGDAETGGRGDAGARGRGDAGTRRAAPSPQSSALPVVLAGLVAWLVDQSAGIASATTALLFWLYLGLASAGAGASEGTESPRPQDAKGTGNREQGAGSRPQPRLPFPVPPSLFPVPLVSWGLGVLVVPSVSLAVYWIAVMPIAADVAAARADRLLSAGRYQQAVDGYREGIALRPEADYFLQLGVAGATGLERRWEGDPGAWLKVGEEGLLGAERADPRRADIALAQVRLHRAASNLPGLAETERRKALESARRALLLAPRRPVVWGGYASTLMALGEFEEARSALQQSLELDPLYAPTYGYLGDCYLALGSPEQAVAAFRRGVELDPNSAPLKAGLERALGRAR